MRRQNDFAKDITYAQAKARYNAYALRILSYRQILAKILKETVQELRGLREEEIMACIEDVVIDDQTDNHPVAGLPTVDDVPGEGSVTFDLLVRVRAPDQKGGIFLIINLEAQMSDQQSYDIVERAIVYNARNLSRQIGTIVRHSHYEKLEAVYSIWVVMDSFKSKAWDSITWYHMTKDVLYGEDHFDDRYQLINAVLIRLPENAEFESGNQLIQMLASIFTNKLSPQEKIQLLETKHGIQTSEEVREDVDHMCDFADYFEQQGMQRGMQQGIQKGKQLGIKEGAEKSSLAFAERMIADGQLSNEKIAEYSGLSIDKVNEIASRQER